MAALASANPDTNLAFGESGRPLRMKGECGATDGWRLFSTTLWHFGRGGLKTHLGKTPRTGAILDVV